MGKLFKGNSLKTNKKSAGIVLSVLLGIFFLLGLRIAYQFFIGETIQTTDLEDFRIYKSERCERKLPVFPKKDFCAISGEYFYKYQDFLMDPQVQIYLKLQYSEEEFQKEIARLENLTVDYGNQPVSLKADEENFITKAYVLDVDSSYPEYEYALVSHTQKVIYYIYLQNMKEKGVAIDKALLPKYF